MQSMIRRMDAVKSFFSCFDDSVSIEEFNEEIKEFDFIKPIALIAYKQYLKDAVFLNSNEFSLIQKKIILVFMMALIEKLSQGDVCILLNKEKLTSFFSDEIIKLNLFVSRLDEEDFSVFSNLIESYRASVSDFIEEKIAPNYIQMLSSDSKLISSDLSEVTPLCVYTENNDGYRLYLRSYFHYENTVCNYIKSQNSKINSLDNVELEFYKKALDVLFIDSKDEIEYQKVAAAQSAINQFSVICGGPGTGKTTTVIKLLLLLLAANRKDPLKITLCAPTGKASSRMVESISDGLSREDIGKAIKELCKLNTSISEEELKKSIPTSATTIHSVLGIFPHKEIPKYNENNKLDCDIIVIDEVSMISLSLFSKIIRALPEKTKVIMLGDKDQLNSVQPGSVLADICSQLYKEKPVSEQKLSVLSKVTSYSKEDLCKKNNYKQSAISDNVSLLMKSRRFDSNSVLGIVANSINASNTKGDDFCKKTDNNISKASSIEDLFRSDNEVSFFNIKDKSRKAQLKVATSIANEIVDKYSKDGAYINLLEQCNYVIDKNNSESSKKIFNALDKYRVLCALNEGCLGTKVINNEIAKLLQKRLQSKKSNTEIPLKNKEGEFAVGSVILITKNDKLLGVDNGEVGFVAYDSEESKQKGSVKVFFPAIDSDKPRVISPERLKEYDAGFAMTIHKSQGCEYQHVCMVLPPIDNPIMTKELIYTGITRAKASSGADPRVYIIGEKELFLSSIVKRVKRESGLSLMI